MTAYQSRDPDDAALAELLLIVARLHGQSQLTGALALDLAWVAREWVSGQDGAELVETLRADPLVNKFEVEVPEWRHKMGVRDGSNDV